MVPNPARPLGAFALLFILSSCAASTQFKSTWKAPDAQPLQVKTGDLVVTMVMSKTESTRRTGEDLVGAELKQRGLRSIPSFTLVPTDQIDDKEKAIAAIRDTGAAAVFVLRPMAIDKQQTYVQPTYMGPGPYSAWGPYYSYGWSAAYSPGYVVTNTIVRVEILVFDLRQDKLLWAGQSESTNPEQFDLFVTDLVRAASTEMTRVGVIAPPPKS